MPDKPEKDIVERLRDRYVYDQAYYPPAERIWEEAAKEIETLRSALRAINRVLSPQADRTFDLLISQSQWAVDTARAALRHDV